MSKTQNSDTDQQQFWQMAVEAWQSSGMSVRQFCKQEGLSEPSFYAWRKRLAAVESPTPDPLDVSSSVSSFIEVSLAGKKSGSLELVLTCGILLRIGSDTDRQVISDVLSIVRQAGLC